MGTPVPPGVPGRAGPGPAGVRYAPDAGPGATTTGICEAPANGTHPVCSAGLLRQSYPFVRPRAKGARLLGIVCVPPGRHHCELRRPVVARRDRGHSGRARGRDNVNVGSSRSPPRRTPTARELSPVEPSPMLSLRTGCPA